MTREVMFGSDTRIIYRLRPGDPRACPEPFGEAQGKRSEWILEMRANTKGGRWRVYQVCDSAAEAQALLLRLAKEIRGESDADAHRP